MRKRLLAGFALALLAGCQHVDVTAKTWSTAEPKHVFPERDPAFASYFAGKADLGVCFSAGSTRSTTATLGQLRALDALGILPRVKYIAAVSGGGWAAIPYVYLPDEISDRTFLGDYIPPEQLTLAQLKAPAPRQGLASVLHHAWIIGTYAKNLWRLRGNEAYAFAIDDIFLRPFGLASRYRMQSLNQASLQATLARNPKLQPKNFYLPRAGRPYLIVGASLKTPQDNFLPVEYTPLYSGVRAYFPGEGAEGSALGGDYLETFAYDSLHPVRDAADSSLYHARLQRDLPASNIAQFSLGDMTASTGATPRGYRYTALSGFPRFHAWSSRSGADRPVAAEYPHMDGEMTDALGLMPLLARGVRNIIVFYNTNAAVDDFTPDSLKAGRLPPQIAALFGHAQGSCTADKTQMLPKNQVFNDEGYAALLKDFSRDYQTGAPYFHCGEYSVRPNKFWQIAGGYKVRICWFMLGPSKQLTASSKREQLEWIRQLKDDQIRAVLDPTFARYRAKTNDADDLANFPLYRTVTLKRARLIDLAPLQINALSQYTAWSVMKYQDAIRRHLGL